MYISRWMGSWRWSLVFVSCLVWCEWLLGVRHVLGQSHDLKDVQALIDYDKQLDVLHEQYKGSLRDSVGFALLYHMREDRWKQGGDWESLHYTNISIAALNPHNRYHAANFSSLMPEEAYDEIFFGQLNISRVLQQLPTIRDMELFDALHVHQIRLLTILGRYSDAHMASSNTIRRHTVNFGHDRQLLGLHHQVHEQLSNQTLRAVRLAKSQLVYLQELQDLNRRLRYLTEQRGLLHFVGGQSWLSAGDAVAAVPWFDAAIAAHPCLHQAYYRLSQAVAASPWNNPQNRSLPSAASAASVGNATLRERIEAMENVLRRIYVNTDANLVQLLSSVEDTWTMAMQRTARARSDQEGFFGWLFARKSSVDTSERLSLDPLQQHRALRCTFGDELQYFHVLLRYSQVSDSWEDDEDGDEDDTDGGFDGTGDDGHRGLDANDEEDDADDSDDATVSGNLFASPTGRQSRSKTRAKVSLSASHPAAFAQQSPSQQQPSQSSKAYDADAQPAVVRDYVKVVQAALYWSLFTLADALAGEEPLAFFYLQQARALERFRVDDPRYSQYSATDSHRQVTHIQRTFTAEYYPQPSYPAEVPLTRAAHARLLQTQQQQTHQQPPDVAPTASSPSLLFAHDLFTPDELQNQSIPMDTLRAQWTPPMDEVLYGDSSARPVFIIGFFRSGSTLLETQLSRQHRTLVWGLGEHSAFATQMHHLQQDMLQLAAVWEAQTKQTQAAATNAAAAGARETVEALQRETEAVREERYRRILRRHTAQIDAAMQHRCAQYLTAGGGGGDGDSDGGTLLRHRYDDRITTLHPRCTRIIDKMLLNYRNVGLIHLLYPQAVVLHTVRDPMDTMWSCMTHRFGDSAAYTLNIRLLVEEFTWYLQTMRHFRRTLPPRPPIWALSTTTGTAGDRTVAKKSDTKSDKTSEKKKKASRTKPKWQNVALCPAVSPSDSARRSSSSSRSTGGGGRNETHSSSAVAFPLFCRQRRQQAPPVPSAVRRRRKPQTASDEDEGGEVSLLPMVDVRYDAMITRPQHVLREIYGLLQLPLPPSLALTGGDDDRGDGEAAANGTAATSATSDSVTTGPVRTASYLQVRRPINDAAQGKWRRYAAQLRHTLWPLWQDAWKQLQQRAARDNDGGGDGDAVPFNTDDGNGDNDTDEDVAGVAMNWSGALTDDGYDYRAALRRLAKHLDATYNT